MSNKLRLIDSKLETRVVFVDIQVVPKNFLSARCKNYKYSFFGQTLITRDRNTVGSSNSSPASLDLLLNFLFNNIQSCK